MNERAFEEAVRRMQARMYRTAVSVLRNDEDAADAIQEAVLRVWRKRHSLRKAAAFDVWLTRILLNEWETMCQGFFYLSPKHSTIWYSARRRPNPFKQSICINIRANDDVGAWTTFS